MAKAYQVKTGWIEYVQVGSRIEERFSDNPDVWDFPTLEEAREKYDEQDPRADYIDEKMTAGKAFRERDAYKCIEVSTMMDGLVEVDDPNECEWLEYEETIAFEKWGRDQYLLED